MEKPQRNKTDEPLSLVPFYHQLTFGFRLSKLATQKMAALFARARPSEGRMIFHLGRPLENDQLFGIGSGQGMERTSYNGFSQQEFLQFLPKAFGL